MTSIRGLASTSALLCASVAVSLCADSVLAQSRRQSDNDTAASVPRHGGAESADVELTILPFYAVDERGEPVHDLRQEEIELVVGGQVIGLDTFDSWIRGDKSTKAEAEVSASAGRVLPPRHIFLFFDQAFSAPMH